MAPGTRMQLYATSGPVRVIEPHSSLSVLISRPACAVPPSCTLADAVETMRAEGVSALVVGDRAGIVTERDLARAMAAGLTLDDTVGRAATWHPLVVAGATTVVAAAGLMLNEHVRHLLIELDDGKTGVVSIRDLMAVLLQAADPHLWLTSLRVAIETPSEIWLG